MFVVRKVLSSKRSTALKNVIISARTASSVKTNDYIIDSGLPNVEIPKISIPEAFLPNLDKFTHLIATECAETGRKYTYADLRQKSRNLGKSLRKKLKLNHGDVLALILPNVPEYPIAVHAALQFGIVVTTLNPIYTPEEIVRQLTDSSAKAIITLNELYDVVKNSTTLLKKKLPIITIKTEPNQCLPEGAINFSEFSDDNSVDYPDFHLQNPENLAFLPYSSGTTGLPKGVELTHQNVVATIQQILSPDLNFIVEPHDNFQEVVPMVLPLFHIYGSTLSTFLLAKGSKIVTISKFTPELFTTVLKKHKPTLLFMVPPLVLFLTTHPEIKSEDLQSVRVNFCGAAPLGALDEEKFVEKIGKKVHMLQGYGLTETTGSVALTPIKLADEKNVSGSIGKPTPNSLVKIVAIDDPTGTPLGPNTTGELLVKGPQLMKGYHNNPEETKNIFLDGWLRTGDLAFYNDDKILFIADRLKELIKVKGFQVPPAELEEIIRDFPNVEEAAVIGISHVKHGEVPRAYVVSKGNTKINPGELEKYVSSKVAEYKQLRGGVVLVDSIPKNASGKILRRTLKLEYENHLKNI